MKKFKLKIRQKTIIMIFTFALVLITVSMFLFARVITNYSDKHYQDSANNLSKTVAQLIDVEQFKDVKEKVLTIYNNTEDKVTSEDWGSDAWNEYTAKFDAIQQDPNFISLRDTLRKIQDCNDVDCIYFSVPDAQNKQFIYIVDSAYEDACPPGCIDPLYEINYAILDDPARGFPAYITNTEEYGWLVTAGAPIYEGNTVIGYAMVDISMDEVKAVQRNTILSLIGFLFITVLVISIISIVVVHYILIKPIKTLTEAALKYDSMNTDSTHQVFENLEIYSDDEIAELALSMKHMEMDINKKINDLIKANEELSQSKDDVQKMTRLANKDALTGVRNKISYDQFITPINQKIKDKEKVEFGIVMVDLNYLKLINDSYGHSNGDSALIKLANLICSVFAHSPVFRVGGDEFIVLVQNNDYRNIDQLLDEINGKLDSLRKDDDLPLYERISAAVGFSKYDANSDTEVEDVFNRADILMYQRKSKMKKEEKVKK